MISLLSSNINNLSPESQTVPVTTPTGLMLEAFGEHPPGYDWIYLRPFYDAKILYVHPEAFINLDTYYSFIMSQVELKDWL